MGLRLKRFAKLLFRRDLETQLPAVGKRRLQAPRFIGVLRAVWLELRSVGGPAFFTFLFSYSFAPPPATSARPRTAGGSPRGSAPFWHHRLSSAAISWVSLLSSLCAPAFRTGRGLSPLSLCAPASRLDGVFLPLFAGLTAGRGLSPLSTPAEFPSAGGEQSRALVGLSEGGPVP